MPSPLVAHAHETEQPSTTSIARPGQDAHRDAAGVATVAHHRPGVTFAAGSPFLNPMFLQRTAGNRAVAAWLGVPAPSPLPIPTSTPLVQRKVRIAIGEGDVGKAAPTLATRLLDMPSEDASARIMAIDDPSMLAALQKVYTRRRPPKDVDTAIRLQLILNTLNVRRAQRMPVEQVLAVFRRLLKRRSAKGILPGDEAKLRDLLAAMPAADVKTVEKVLILLPTFANRQARSDATAIVTERARKAAADDPSRGRFFFGDEAGEEVTGSFASSTEMFDAMKAKAEEFAGIPRNLCLEFLEEASTIIFDTEPARRGAAEDAYETGAAGRKRNVDIHAVTLSRFAAELRVQGLAGPTHVLEWKGGHATGRHEPRPSDVVDSLSVGGEGWYFFYVNQFFFHTFAIAVHVTADGAREYFHVSDNGADRLGAEELNEKADFGVDPRGEDSQHTRAVGSRLWQLYSRPTQE